MGKKTKQRRHQRKTALYRKQAGRCYGCGKEFNLEDLIQRRMVLRVYRLFCSPCKTQEDRAANESNPINKRRSLSNRPTFGMNFGDACLPDAAKVTITAKVTIELSQSYRLRNRLYDEANGKCYWCKRDTILQAPGKKIDKDTPKNIATVDHIHSKFNLNRRSVDNRKVLACLECNHSRGRFEQQLHQQGITVSGEHMKLGENGWEIST